MLCVQSKLLLAVSTLLRAALQIPSSDWGTAREPRRKSSSVEYCRPSKINDKNAAINDKDAAINDKDAAVTDQSCTEIFKEIEMVSSYAALTVPDSHDRHLRGPQVPFVWQTAHINTYLGSAQVQWAMHVLSHCFAIRSTEQDIEFLDRDQDFDLSESNS